MFITSEKGGVARAKGVGEKEKECTTEYGAIHDGCCGWVGPRFELNF